MADGIVEDPKYGRVKFLDSPDKWPDPNEPIFIIRARDIHGAQAASAYASIVEGDIENGQDPELVMAAKVQAEHMRRYKPEEKKEPDGIGFQDRLAKCKRCKAPLQAFDPRACTVCVHCGEPNGSCA